MPNCLQIKRAVIVVVAMVCVGPPLAVATSAMPIYDWDFTPAHVQLQGTRIVNAFVTIRNLPHSPVNLLGSRWYALDMYPGAAAEPGGPFSITHLSSAGFESMNLAPGESRRVFVARFVQQPSLPIGYSDLLIAGAHMRVLGPSDEFIDVGGLNKQLRVTVIPEPATVAPFALAAVATVFVRRSKSRRTSPPSHPRGPAAVIFLRPCRRLSFAINGVIA